MSVTVHLVGAQVSPWHSKRRRPMALPTRWPSSLTMLPVHGPRLWKLPEPWTHRTRPPLLGKRTRRVFHSSHSPIPLLRGFRNGTRRPVRGVRATGSKSGREALPASSPAIRHGRTGQLVTDTIPHCPSNQPEATASSSGPSPEARFSTPTNGSRRQARPVSRRYRDVETGL
jgi:hypothetical protein